MKTCTKCLVLKPLEEFHRSSRAKDGRQSWCKECANSAVRLSAKKNPEPGRESDRRYRQTDKYKATRKTRRDGPARELIREQKRESWQRNRGSNLEKLRVRNADPDFQVAQRERRARWRAKDPRGVHRHSLKSTYGLTLEEWDAMLIRQLACCAICGRQSRDLHVDHCHATGEIRGLLCNSCNNGLGRFADDPERLIAAARYLMEHKRAA